MNVIFSYELDDAWFIPKHSITVYDTDVDNVVCCVDREVVKDKYTISKKSIRAICEIVEINHKILEFRNGDIEFAGVLDGVVNIFVFSDGNRRNKLNVLNIWAFQGKETRAVNANAVLSVFECISDILKKDGVDQFYLTLQ